VWDCKLKGALLLFYRSGNYHELSALEQMFNKCSFLLEGTAALAMTSYQDWYGTCRTYYSFRYSLIWYSIPLLDILLKNAVLDSFPPSVVYFITLCDAWAYILLVSKHNFELLESFPLDSPYPLHSRARRKWVQLACLISHVFPFFFSVPFFFFFLSAFLYIFNGECLKSSILDLSRWTA